MRIIDSPEQYGKVSRPVVLTIGNFDGVHLGHQTVLSHVVEKARKIGGTSVVLSFTNHPSSIISPESPSHALCTPFHKVQLIGNLNIDTLLHLNFSESISGQEAGVFLTGLKEAIPFSHLVLGHDARMGKERSGDRNTILSLSSSLNFDVEYLEPKTVENVPVSSSQIRKLIQKGNVEAINILLNRQHSIYAPVISFSHKHGTLSMDVAGLCLPPDGLYAVQLKHHDKLFSGVGKFETTQKPILEITFSDEPKNLPAGPAEVFLLRKLHDNIKVGTDFFDFQHS